jgi:hypothetical protein
MFRGGFMLAFLLSCAVCVPVIGIYHLITRVPVLAILVVILNCTVGVFAGAMYGWFSNRRGEEKSVVWLIAGSVTTGIVVTTVQYAVAFEAVGFNFLALFWGAMLGGIGGIMYMVSERPGKGKEDAAREDRFQQVIDHQGDQISDTSKENQGNA